MSIVREPPYLRIQSSRAEVENERTGLWTSSMPQLFHCYCDLGGAPQSRARILTNCPRSKAHSKWANALNNNKVEDFITTAEDYWTYTQCVR